MNNPMVKKIFFCYFKPLTYSGQSAASELIVEELSKRGWNCSIIPVYPLERGVNHRFRSYGSFIAKQVITTFQFLRLLGEKKPILHLNLGQGLGSFIRVGLPYFPIRLLKPAMRVVISLHGSVFMEWEKSQLATRIFLYFLRGAELITVLGNNQKSYLTQLGITGEKIMVLQNTSELDVCSKEKIIDKHKSPEIIRILHLSLLIESKGFPLFLEALEQLSLDVLSKRIDAVICGPMAFTSYCSELDTATKKERWIVDKVNLINASGNGMVSLRWVRGAAGEEKNSLFKNSHIFCFPSHFPVEAQPLVLLEAMASGCALITSDVGEIPSTLSDVDAVVLTNISPAALATEMKKLIIDDARRMEMALSGRKATLEQYSIQNYGDRWEAIFTQLSGLES